MNENNNGHRHDLPLVKITITFDPNHSSLNYQFENCDHAQTIGYLELTKQFAFRDMLAQQQTQPEKN